MIARNIQYALMSLLLLLNAAALLAGGKALWVNCGCALRLSAKVNEATGDEEKCHSAP